ncbi:MAG: hypothetical protein ACOCX9_03460 [Spirochaetota bacterium]
MKKLINLVFRRKKINSIQEMELYPEFMIRSEPTFQPWQDNLVLNGIRFSSLLEEKAKRRKPMPRRYLNAEKRIHERFAPIERRFTIGTSLFGIVLLAMALLARFYFHDVTF